MRQGDYRLVMPVREAQMLQCAPMATFKIQLSPHVESIIYQAQAVIRPIATNQPEVTNAPKIANRAIKCHTLRK